MWAAAFVCGYQDISQQWASRARWLRSTRRLTEGWWAWNRSALLHRLRGLYGTAETSEKAYLPPPLEIPTGWVWINLASCFAFFFNSGVNDTQTLVIVIFYFFFFLLSHQSLVKSFSLISSCLVLGRNLMSPLFLNIWGCSHCAFPMAGIVWLFFSYRLFCPSVFWLFAGSSPISSWKHRYFPLRAQLGWSASFLLVTPQHLPLWPSGQLLTTSHTPSLWSVSSGAQNGFPPCPPSRLPDPVNNFLERVILVDGQLGEKSQYIVH